MKAGFITIPFGLVYALVSLHIGYESKPAVIIVLAAAIITVYKILGMPPTE